MCHVAVQACCNCLWALAVLQGCSLPAFPALVSALTVRDSWNAMEEVQQTQLFQVP